MKQILITILFNIICFVLFAQESRIEKIRAKLSTTTDSLIVNYDLSGKRKAFNVKLEVSTLNQQNIQLTNVFGDFGNNIQPGMNKTIIWDMKADHVDLAGSNLFVKVTGNVFIPGKVKKEVWIPWLYIASGACATTGVYAQIRANTIYESYTPSFSTDEAEQLHKEVNQMLTVRNVAYVAAGALGIVGVVVHIKHNQKKKAVLLSYIPVNEGAVFGLNFKF